MNGAPPPGQPGRPATWSLAIDFGTTASVAAVDDGMQVRLATFGASTRLASGVFVDDDGALVAGTVAASRGGAAPGRYIRTPKRHVGRDREVVVSGQTIEVADLVAAVLADIRARVVQQMGGADPARVVLTHPARWGSTARQTLLDAAERAGLGAADLVPEPIAAGHGLGVATGVDAAVAVYDLGGGTLDTAVLRGRPDGGWAIAGPPGGLDPFGGETFDALVHHHLVDQVARRDLAAAARLQAPSSSAERGYARTWWRDLRSLKEELSETVSGQIAVPGTDHTVLLTRDEVEHLVADPVRRSVAELVRTLQAAGTPASSLTRIVLSGDAARMPIVDRLVREHHPDALVRSADDPKGVVATGALAPALAAASAGPVPPGAVPHRPVPPVPPPPPPEARTAPPPPPPPRDRRSAVAPTSRSRSRVAVLAASAILLVVAVSGAVAAGAGGDGDGAGPGSGAGAAGPGTTAVNGATTTTATTSTTASTTTVTPEPPTGRTAVERHLQTWADLDENCAAGADLPAGALVLFDCNGVVAGTDEAFEFGWMTFESATALAGYLDGIPQSQVVERGPWNFDAGNDLGEYLVYDEDDGSGGIVWTFDDDLVLGYIVSDLGSERADELWGTDGNAGVA